MARVIAFDVNETLLDLRSLDEMFDRAFGDRALRQQWFALMLQLSFVGAITGEYVDFTTAQHAALRMLAERQDVAVADTTAGDIVRAMTKLAPYPDVVGGLQLLRSTELSVVALTNSVLEIAEAQLEHAGIRNLFDRVMSADTVRRLKPAKEPYLAVADAFGVPPSDVRLVAAHHWDVAGALQAGCRAAFVARPGMVMSPLGPQPDIVGRTIDDVARQIIAVDVSDSTGRPGS